MISDRMLTSHLRTKSWLFGYLAARSSSADGDRRVATAISPFSKIRSVKSLPKPDEAPVTVKKSQNLLLDETPLEHGSNLLNQTRGCDILGVLSFY